MRSRITTLIKYVLFLSVLSCSTPRGEVFDANWNSCRVGTNQNSTCKLTYPAPHDTTIFCMDKEDVLVLKEKLDRCGHE